MDSKTGNLHKLGIMGGTFDPIHLGHLKVAEVAQSRFSLEKVIFVPASCPPHKSLKDITSFEHRYEMVNLAIKRMDCFESSRIEMEISCPCYAGDTIRAFKERYGEGWQIYFITGLDIFQNIMDWDKSRIHPGLCQFIAATRPGYNREGVEENVPDDFLPYITILEEPSLSISSTEIRSRVKAQKPIDEMVPEAVRDYIVTWGLYQDEYADY